MILKQGKNEFNKPLIAGEIQRSSIIIMPHESREKMSYILDD